MNIEQRLKRLELASIPDSDPITITWVMVERVEDETLAEGYRLVRTTSVAVDLLKR